MNITLIAAIDENNAIGYNNQLLCHLPKDLQFFKASTWAMPVLMGRKTFDSLKGEGLKGRWNIVLSKQAITNDKVTIVGSIDEAIELLRAKQYKQLFVIGGASIYEQTLPLAQQLILTQIHHQFQQADAFFPNFTTDGNWYLDKTIPQQADEKHPYSFNFQFWKRK